MNEEERKELIGQIIKELPIQEIKQKIFDNIVLTSFLDKKPSNESFTKNPSFLLLLAFGLTTALGGMLTTCNNQAELVLKQNLQFEEKIYSEKIKVITDMNHDFERTIAKADQLIDMIYDTNTVSKKKKFELAKTRIQNDTLIKDYKTKILLFGDSIIKQNFHEIENLRSGLHRNTLRYLQFEIISNYENNIQNFKPDNKEAVDLFIKTRNLTIKIEGKLDSLTNKMFQKINPTSFSSSY